MRLSSSSITIVSIFASSSHAFAPPPPHSLTTSSRLQAGNDLSGLLSEYSGSATKAAGVAVKTVADPTSSTVTMAPPPDAVATVAEPAKATAASSVDMDMDSVVKAASMAQEAADQAAAAAAAVATKGVAATKAAAAAAGAVAAGGAAGVQFKVPDIQWTPPTQIKAPPIEWVAPSPQTKLLFQVDPNKLNYDNPYDASARAQENLAIIKANWQEFIPSLKGLTGIESIDLPAFDLDVSSVRDGSGSAGPTLSEIITTLNFPEYGAWYTVAALAIIASQQRSAGNEEASAEFELELANARAKASEAATAAGLAAEGANTAKKLAMKMEKGLKKDGGKAMLESSKSKKAQMEKEIMEKEMRALQAEVSSLRSQLEKIEGEKNKTTVKTKKVKTEIEEEYPSKVIVDTGADEGGRIIELLKEIDEENRQKKAEELEKKRVEEAKFVAKQKAKAESKKMTKGVEAAQAKAEVAKKEAAKKKAKKASAKTKSNAVKRKATTKSVTKKAARAVIATADDWASLAESTLKRKTVAQLTEYLTGKVSRDLMLNLLIIYLTLSFRIH
ncbi:hypothetical protein ACHAWF_004863 [Thalassiosira exigua]